MTHIQVAVVNLFHRAKEAAQERGASGVEYGILVAAIAAVIVAVAFSIGGEIKTEFTTVETELKK